MNSKEITYKKIDFLKVIFLIIIWFIPISYVGVFNKRINFLGNYLNNQYRISCLFPKRPNSFFNLYYQIQFIGSNEWISLDEKDFDFLDNFAHKSRIKPMYQSSFNEDKIGSPRGKRRRDEIAIFLKKEYEKLYPESKEIYAIRFVTVSFFVGDKEIAHPQKGWEIKPLDIYKDKWEIHSEHYFY